MGKNNSNVVPTPNWLCTPIAPPSVVIMSRTAAKPNPRPVILVVKNGSKMRAAVWGSIPLPLSCTRKQTYRPGVNGSIRPWLCCRLASLVSCTSKVCTITSPSRPS